MRIRTTLIGSLILAALPLGCSEPTSQTQVQPANPNVTAPPKTDKGVAVTKKHVLPTGPSPSAVVP